MRQKICDISRSEKSELTVIPRDEYYVHKNQNITIGNEYYKKLRDECSEKLREHDEIDVNINLTKLNSELTIDLSDSDEGINHILNYIIKKSEEEKTKDLNKVHKTYFLKLNIALQILHGAQIVCNRGAFRTLGLSFCKPKGWAFAVEKYHNVLFLKELRKPYSDHDNIKFGYIFEDQIFAHPEEVDEYKF